MTTNEAYLASLTKRHAELKDLLKLAELSGDGGQIAEVKRHIEDTEAAVRVAEAKAATGADKVGDAVELLRTFAEEVRVAPHEGLAALLVMTMAGHGGSPRAAAAAIAAAVERVKHAPEHELRAAVELLLTA